MGHKKRILLYGNSVVLGCVGASLEGTGRFQITHLSPPLSGTSQLETFTPDVILFDAENGNAEAAFSLLKDRPDLLLLSVSPDGNVVRLWSGRQYEELSTMDFTALIETGPPSGVALDEPLANTRSRGADR
jgi:hypothetical protein